MRITTGDYLVLFYDEYGAKVKDLTTTATSLTEAMQVGDARLSVTGPRSYSIDRRVYNSLDPKNKV
jgi:hypothetical protein